MLLWQLILIQVITFAILVFLLRQFLHKQNSQALERLQQLYQENLKREEDLKKAQEAADQQLKEKIAQHNEEIGKLKAAGEVDVQKMHEEVLAKAKEEAKKIVDTAEAKREQIKASLVSEMEEKALVLAFDIIGHIFTAQVAQGIHHQLINEFIEEIEKSDGQRMQLNVETAEIAAPYPLTQVQEENLKNILSSKMGRSVNIKGTIDQEIVAGMVVRLENLVLDGSLRNKLKGTLAYVRSSLAS
ncbi:MAG: F0F1 ATP synthase subunit delta [Candidatus Binatia bacterium]